MPTHNPDNERIKHRYLHYLREAKRLSEHSADAAAAALSRFETYTGSRDFKRYHIQQAIGFKRLLLGQVSGRTGEPHSGATILSTLNALRAFSQWFALQPGYKSRINYADADYFTLPEREARSARVSLERPIPSIEQILHVLRNMPAVTETQLRNRAVITFILLTGVRDGAAASLRLNTWISLKARGWSTLRRRLECTPASGQRQAADLTICRACSCSNFTGLRYPSAEWSRLLL